MYTPIRTFGASGGPRWVTSATALARLTGTGTPLVTAVGVTSPSALLDMAEAEDHPDAASFGRSSRHDEQPLLLRAR